MAYKIKKSQKKKKQTGFAELGHYDWEKEKRMTKKQKRESGWG